MNGKAMKSLQELEAYDLYNLAYFHCAKVKDMFTLPSDFLIDIAYGASYGRYYAHTFSKNGNVTYGRITFAPDEMLWFARWFVKSPFRHNATMRTYRVWVDLNAIDEHTANALVIASELMHEI